MAFQNMGFAHATSISRVLDTSSRQVNFAGLYVLSTFACGVSCIISFANDKKSGDVVWLYSRCVAGDNVEAGFSQFFS